jgi:hypothetical protein
MFFPARSLASLVVCLGAAAGSAHGQCNVYRWNVPDFDQKRNGLAGDGGMYCVPTSATNWMAYIANHGYSPMMSGPRDWPSQSNYSLVTSTDSFMGALMGTTAAGGTGGAGGLAGLQTFMFSRAPFLFTTSLWYGMITPLDMWIQMQTNGLVDACYGYYNPVPGPSGNFYVRNGGHCVTLNGLENICTPAVHPTLRVRNPADDTGLFSQSPFATATTHGILETFPTAPLPGFFSTLTRLEDFGAGSATRRYLDTMYVIRANFNCWAPAGNSPEIHLSKAVALFGDPQAQNVTFTLPPGAIANSIAVHPDQTKLAYVRSTGEGAGLTHRIHLLNLGTSEDLDFGLLLPAVHGKTPIAFNRFGRLITCDGSVLKVTDVSGRAPVVVASRQLETAASSICFDDVNDEVVVLTPSNRRLIRCSMDLATVIDEPLPPEVPAMGDGSVTPDPTNHRYLITIVGDGSVRELSLIAGSPRLQLTASLLLPAVQSIQDIQPADGGGFYAMCDGSVRVLDRDPTNGRLRISPIRLFEELPAMRCMSISRSRTNFDAALHTGPAWDNLPDANENVASVVDCRGDYNLNGRVDVQDIFEFIAGWFASDPRADVNDSASLTVQDVFDFISAWFGGC